MITLLVLVGLGLFVWVSMARGDAKFRREENLPANAPLPAPEGVRGLFWVVVVAVLFGCVGLPMVAGIEAGLQGVP